MKFINTKRVIIFISLLFIWVVSNVYFLPILFEKLHVSYLNLFIITTILFTIFFLSLLIIGLKKNEQKLSNQLKYHKETIARYDALSAATNDAIWDVNLKTNETYYNNRIMEVFGFNRNDLENNTEWWLTNIHPKDIARVEKRMNKSLESNITEWQDEYQFRCKNGDYKTVYDRSYIIRDEQGKAVRLIGAMKDITKIRQLEKKLSDGQLENKNKLSIAIMEAHVDERKKIREELHEDINQILAAVKIYMHNNSDENNESINYLDEAMQKIKKLSSSLSPANLAYFGLMNALVDFYHKIQNENPRSKINLVATNFDETLLTKNTKDIIYKAIFDFVTMLLEQSKSISFLNIELSNINRSLIINIIYEEANNEIIILDLKKIIEIRNTLEPYNSKLIIKSNLTNSPISK